VIVAAQEKVNVTAVVEAGCRGNIACGESGKRKGACGGGCGGTGKKRLQLKHPSLMFVVEFT